MGVSKEITDALPVALLRPFSSGVLEGFDRFYEYFGADSLTARLASIFNVAESTFYVAVYFVR
jgi:spore maturation protein SpmB